MLDNRHTLPEAYCADTDAGKSTVAGNHDAVQFLYTTLYVHVPPQQSAGVAPTGPVNFK